MTSAPAKRMSSPSPGEGDRRCGALAGAPEEGAECIRASGATGERLESVEQVTLEQLRVEAREGGWARQVFKAESCLPECEQCSRLPGTSGNVCLSSASSRARLR
jgi:hypothetical protein